MLGARYSRTGDDLMLTHRLIRLLCGLAIAGSLVAYTGCGGDDKKSDSNGGGSVSDYKSGAEKAANDFKNSAQAASGQVTAATTTDEKVKGLEALKASVTTAADDFEKLNPPANVKADNDELVKEFRQLASDVDAVEQALKTNDKAKAQAALTRLQDNQTKIATTISSIQSKIGG
jgi:hypothetical protein